MSAPDRLTEELLTPLVDEYYEALSALVSGVNALGVPVSRDWCLGVMGTLARAGDRAADVLGVARPDWAVLRMTAGLDS